MKKSFFVLMVVFSCTIGISFAQSIISSSVTSLTFDKPYEILPMDEGVFGISVDRLKKEIHYFFTDDNFNIKTSGKYSTGNHSIAIKQKVKGDKAYVFINLSSSRNFQKIIMTIDSHSGEVTLVPINNYSLTNIRDFYVLENSIAMTGMFNEHMNIVQFVDINSKWQKPYTINLDMKIFDIAESDGYLDILAASQTGKNANKLQLLTLNDRGEILYAIDTDTGLGKNDVIKSAYLQKTHDGKFRAVGAYSTSKKELFSGYFYWDMDYSLEQNFVLHPIASLKGFAHGSDKKLNRQIKYEMTKGFEIVKVLEENGQLAIVSAPNFEYSYEKRYPRKYNNELFHVLYLAEDGKMMWDETFALHRSLRSPYVDNRFITNPPMYIVNGNVYFLYHEEFTPNPSLIVHNLRSDDKLYADELSFTIPQNAQLYKTIKFKDNEIIVYGIKENRPIEQNFFLGKIPLF